MSARTSLNHSSKELRLAGIIPFSATDWPGKLTVTAFTQGCPWRCVYCHNPQLQGFAGGDHSMSDVCELLEQRRGLIDGLIISGGEPLAQPALPAAIAQVHSRGFAVGLHTAGYSPTRLSRLFDTPETTPDWIGLDIKGLPATMPDVVGCTPKGAARSWEALSIATAAGVPLQVRTTLWPGSIVEKQLPVLREQVAHYGQELVIQWARGVDKHGRLSD